MIDNIIFLVLLTMWTHVIVPLFFGCAVSAILGLAVWREIEPTRFFWMSLIMAAIIHIVLFTNLFRG